MDQYSLLVEKANFKFPQFRLCERAVKFCNGSVFSFAFKFLFRRPGLLWNARRPERSCFPLFEKRTLGVLPLKYSHACGSVEGTQLVRPQDGDSRGIRSGPPVSRNQLGAKAGNTRTKFQWSAYSNWLLKQVQTWRGRTEHQATTWENGTYVGAQHKLPAI